MAAMMLLHGSLARGAALARPARAPTLILAGHEGLGVPLDEPIKRYVVKVSALDLPQEGRNRYAVHTENDDFALNEMQSWRLTCITGSLTGKTFLVQGNTASVISVIDSNHLLGKLARGDLIMLESIIQRDVPAYR